MTVTSTNQTPTGSETREWKATSSPVSQNTASNIPTQNQPIPLSDLVPNSASGSPKLVPDKNGIAVVETPLPCLAYLFMLPFPFFCMGCCMFKQSEVEFDENTRLVTVVVRRGACPCSRKKTFSYDDIGNVAVRPVSLTVDGVKMHETLIVLRDSTMIGTGRVESKESAFEFAKEIHLFIFGRSGKTYVPPTMSDILLS